MCEGTAHSISDALVHEDAADIANAAAGSAEAASASTSDPCRHISPTLSHVAWMDDKNSQEGGGHVGQKPSVHPSWLLQDERDKEHGWREASAVEQERMEEADEASTIRSALVCLCDELGLKVLMEMSAKMLRRRLERQLGREEGGLDEWKKELMEWYESWLEDKTTAERQGEKKVKKKKSKGQNIAQKTKQGQVAKGEKLLHGAPNKKRKELHEASGEGTSAEGQQPHEDALQQQSEEREAKESAREPENKCSVKEATDGGKEQRVGAQAEYAAPGPEAASLEGGNETLEIARPDASAQCSIVGAGAECAKLADADASGTSVADVRDACMPTATRTAQREDTPDKEARSASSHQACSPSVIGSPDVESSANLRMSTIEGSGGGRMGASTNGQAHVRATEGPNTLYARCIVAMRLHAHARTHTHAHAHARTQFHTWKTFI